LESEDERRRFRGAGGDIEVEGGGTTEDGPEGADDDDDDDEEEIYEDDECESEMAGMRAVPAKAE